MTTEVTFTPSAYSLLLLHSARHPQNTTTGFLLGSASGKETKVEKVIPLNHHWTNLAVVEDVALKLLEAHQQSSTTSDPQLLGIYEVPSNIKAEKLSHSATRLASKLSQRTKTNALAVLVDLSKLILIPPVHGLESFVVKDNGNVQAGGKTQLQDEQATIEKTLKLIRDDKLWKDLRDFDDHLEDVSVDWLDNSNVTKAIAAAK
ncbi:unnamed protein product [Sympodiomycopsis kandeliae]